MVKLRSGDDKDRVKAAVKPLGISVNIDTDNVQMPGYVLTAGLGLTFVSALAAMVLTLKRTPPRLQSFILAFCTVWIFATLVPFTYEVAQGKASVHAKFANGTPVPDQLVSAQEKALGSTRIYNKLDYRKRHLLFSLICASPRGITRFFQWMIMTLTFMVSSITQFAPPPSSRGSPSSSRSSRLSSLRCSAGARPVKCATSPSIKKSQASGYMRMSSSMILSNPNLLSMHAVDAHPYHMKVFGGASSSSSSSLPHPDLNSLGVIVRYTLLPHFCCVLCALSKTFLTTTMMIFSHMSPKQKQTNKLGA
jgi:hypothetical protein